MPTRSRTAGSKRGSLVVLQTGAEEFFGLDGVGDVRVVDADDNVDDLFDFVNPGFSGEAVQWLFDHRNIDGVGSDAYGPDAATDANFDATFTVLANDGIALVAIASNRSTGSRSYQAQPIFGSSTTFGFVNSGPAALKY